MLVYFKKIILSLFFTSVLTSGVLFADIKQIDSLSVLGEQIEQMDLDTLVVFDVDEVIFTDQDAILKPIGDPLKFQIFNECYAKAQTDSEKDLVTAILSLPLKIAKKKLVEESIPEIISKLQERQIKVIALTSCPTRPFGVIKSFEEWRLNHIDQFGIDFSSSFPNSERFVLKNMTSYHVPPPVYNKGVIFAEGFSKADVLHAFLKRMDYQPKKIIFIDDMYANVQQMQNKFSKQKIDFQGYCYVKVQKDSENDLNEKLARYQFDYLFKNQKWLSDQEASQKISKEAQ